MLCDSGIRFAIVILALRLGQAILYCYLILKKCTRFQYRKEQLFDLRGYHKELTPNQCGNTSRPGEIVLSMRRGGECWGDLHCGTKTLGCWVETAGRRTPPRSWTASVHRRLLIHGGCTSQTSVSIFSPLSTTERGITYEPNTISF